MEYIKNTLEFQIIEPTVVTFGKFDGLHRGHELLMQEVVRYGKLFHLKTVAFTFDIPPKNKIENVSGKVLTTNEEKQHIFEVAGIDYLLECPFTKEVMCMEPKAFIEWIGKSLNMKCVVIGTDFCFGHKRTGNFHTLQMYESEFGYKTIVVSKIQEDNRDISSTFIREEIAKGNIRKANRLLGYAYFVKSYVVHGNKIGRTIGIPTINMELPTEKLLPPNGVYVTRVIIGNDSYIGVTNVGSKPTVSDLGNIVVETHIVEFSRDIYNQIVVVEFLDYIRSEKKFESLDALKEQMKKDIAYAKRYVIDLKINIQRRNGWVRR